MTNVARNALIGAWKLVSFVERDTHTGIETYPMGTQPEGIIMYTPDGYMSAQFCPPGRRELAGNDPFTASEREYKNAAQTYFAYSGPFYLDESRGLLEHEMFVSFFPNWRGQRQVRTCRIEGAMLYLSPEAPFRFNGSMKIANLAWQRVPPNL